MIEIIIVMVVMGVVSSLYIYIASLFCFKPRKKNKGIIRRATI